MTYSVKEIFYTLQGEGANAGRAAVFCRFAGCNLWSGREIDRASAKCNFCDTDFVGVDGIGGGKFDKASGLAKEIASYWPQDENAHKFVVFTGGEPLLQLDDALIEAVHAHGFTIAIETNGTLPVPAGVDWVCVSPKAGVPIIVNSGQELKLVFPQLDQNPADFEHLKFEYFYLQPKDTSFEGKAQGKDYKQETINYCVAHPKWRLSLQTHKILGIR